MQRAQQEVNIFSSLGYKKIKKYHIIEQRYLLRNWRNSRNQELLLLSKYKSKGNINNEMVYS